MEVLLLTAVSEHKSTNNGRKFGAAPISTWAVKLIYYAKLSIEIEFEKFSPACIWGVEWGLTAEGCPPGATCWPDVTNLPEVTSN